ncbi:unnamed protein product [Orchesella dallaii]|uniref:Uncharacterized protein n=1 Tax=Orchesella dallaii TaxID=48710 RepID=A0ABP1RJM1_9HEXA
MKLTRLSRRDALQRHESTCLMKGSTFNTQCINFHEGVTIFNPEETYINLFNKDETVTMATEKVMTLDQYSNRDFRNHLTKFQKPFLDFQDSTIISINGIEYEAKDLFSDIEVLRFTLCNDISLRKQLRIIEYRIIHEFPKKRRENIVSKQIFEYFIPDKLLFTGLDTVSLQRLAKYGQKIGDFVTNISCSDFIILKEQQDFSVICNQAAENLHLIEYANDTFKLINSTGSTVNIENFIETNTFCYDFPACSCEFGADDYAIEFVFQIIDKNDLMTTRKIPIPIQKVKPRLLEVLKLQNIIELFDILNLYDTFSAKHQHSKCLNAWKNKENQFHLTVKACNEHIMELIRMFFYHQCNESQRAIMKYLAVDIISPNLARNMKDFEADTEILQKFIENGLINQTEDRLKLSSKSVAWYLIAELILDDKKPDCGDSLINAKFIDCVFGDCFEPYKMMLTIPSENSVERIETKMKDLITFKNSMFANFLELLIDKQNEKTGLINLIEENFTIKTIQKWVLACVIGNYPHLFKLLLSFGMHSKLVEFQSFLLLAVYNGSAAIIELVIEQYRKHDREHLLAIAMELEGQEFLITPLHLAATTGNFSVMNCLLQYEILKDCLRQTNLIDIPHYCVFNTYRSDASSILERIQILELLVNQRPNILQLKNRYNQTALLAPYVHVDLIIHMINLGSDVSTTDKESENILHKCSNYVTPQEYHKLVRTLYMMEKPEIFHSENKRKQTPLLVAVIYLDLLDSTIECFLAAKVDFNAKDVEGHSVLFCAIMYNRSARLLDALTRAGADFWKRTGNFNGTVLHFAVSYGNLSALGYFISKGCDVNAMDQRRYTPLALSLEESKRCTHEIVQILVRNGADVNARVEINGLECTPLVYALRKYSQGEIENRTVELLKAAGAQNSVKSSLRLGHGI